MSDDVPNISATFAAEETLSELAEAYFSTPSGERESLMRDLMEFSTR